jgi:4-oxalmesaconate hydratase
MIIDCHGHYTTAPKGLQVWRDGQLAARKEPTSVPAKGTVRISDDEIRESLEQAQLKLQRERGTDVTIFSPRASAMAHHIGDATTSLHWTQHCNDLIQRVCALYPENFVGVCAATNASRPACQLPREGSIRCIGDLRLHRMQSESGPIRQLLGAPPLTDNYWFIRSTRRWSNSMCRRWSTSARRAARVSTRRARTISTPTPRPSCSSDRRPVQGLPGLRFHHSARRRRRATTGAVTAVWRRTEAAAARAELIVDHVFFDTCVYSPGRHRAAAQDHPRGQYPLRSEMVSAVRGSSI